MTSRYERKIKAGAQPFVEQGEEVLAGFVARPRGWTQATAGSRLLGAAQQSRNYDAGERAGLQLASPMALVLTQQRLLVLKIGSPIGLGIGGQVKELVSEVPLGDIDEIEVERLSLGKVVTVVPRRGEPIKLEVNALASAQALADAFAHAKAVASETRPHAA